MRKSPSLIRVLVVDDQALIRQGIASRLASEKDIVVVGEAADAAEALARFRSLRPDIVLMDLSLADVSGHDAIAAIVELDSHSRVVVLTAFAGDLRARRVFAAGAGAYLLRRQVQTDLADTIRTVMDELRIIDPEVKRDLAARSGNEDLSPRELQVLRLLADGLANREIGQRLAITEGTVKTHTKHILRKLGAEDRTHAVVIGMTRGVLAKF